MSFTNASKKFNFNVNTLKLTPEKLAEWCKRRTSNTLPLSQAFSKESSQLSQPSTDCASDPQEMNVTFHRLETIEACKDLRALEKIQESQLHINQDLDYLEKSLESFEDELAGAR
ncbi:16430_t:CDS:2, partial [Racocetra persica]